MRHLITVCSTFAFGLLPLFGQNPDTLTPATPIAPSVTELEGVREAANRLAKTLHLDGAGLSIVRANQELHRSLHGTFSGEQVVPIASASKWLAVATIMTLVEDGTLDLDVPLSRYVKEFERDDRRRVTLRQCLSCVSGLPARINDRMRNWDMKRFTEEAADEAMRAYPGTSFIYGGVSFQMVAVAAERATGKDWHMLFAERIANRLGMRDTQFGSLLPMGGDPGKTTLPWIAGGAVSTLNDYTRFVRMLLAEGEWHGNQVLSRESVKVMLQNQVPKRIDIKTNEVASQHLRYGLGTWIEELDDGVVRLSAPGAFGFTPWIDPDLEIGGVFAVKDRGPKVRRNLLRVQAVVRTAVMSPAVAGTNETVRLRHGGRDRRFHMHVPPYEQNHPGMPLLVVLHGGGGSGEQIRTTTGLDKLGVRQGFVVAFPDGTGRLPKKLLTWNSGGIDVYAQRHEIDDVDFLKNVVVNIQKKVPINSDRIFVVGHSNGGMMCHRLAREAADVFDGIAVVAGAMNFTDNGVHGPIATLLIHGTNDKNVPFEGGPAGGRGKKRIDASLKDAVDYYVLRNGLVAYPQTDVEEGVEFARYLRGKGNTAVLPVQVVTLKKGGHAWPGQLHTSRLLADRAHPWLASRGVIKFFAALRPDMLPNKSPAAPR
ncbi:MAG: poly(3-hydroxybutyrate) depolymerase [Planctomycetota bacterium]|jgi:poly(3-hydroxybutyrate) depolymerase